MTGNLCIILSHAVSRIFVNLGRCNLSRGGILSQFGITCGALEVLKDKSETDCNTHNMDSFNDVLDTPP